MKHKIILLMTVLAACISFSSCFGENTYSSAKKESRHILEKNQIQMQEFAVSALNSKADQSGYFNEYYYYCKQEQGIVKFDIGAQGIMLGGQYWSLVYTESGLLYGEAKAYYFEEEDGNNIIRAEIIKENWWFLWIDYDGTEKSQQ